MKAAITRKEFLDLGARLIGAGITGTLIGCGDDTQDDGAAVTTATTSDETTDGTTGTTTTGTTTGTTGTTTETTTTTGAQTETGGATATTAGETSTLCTDVAAEVGPRTDGPPHEHLLEVPPEDVEAAVEVTYMLSLVSSHVHEVVVTAEMFEMLQMGETVNVSTTEDTTGHQHTVTLIPQC